MIISSLGIVNKFSIQNQDIDLTFILEVHTINFAAVTYLSILSFIIYIIIGNYYDSTHSKTH